jgi:hypothetical protein
MKTTLPRIRFLPRLLAVVVSVHASFASGQSVGAFESPKILLPYDKTLKGADGYDDFVSDDAVHTQVPNLRDAGARLSRCMQSMTIPQSLSIAYPPRVSGAHAASTRTLSCTYQRGSTDFECDVNPVERAVVFDVDPDKYFEVFPDVSHDDALDIARAVLRSEIRFTDEVKDPDLRSRVGLLGTIHRRGDDFAIQYGDCGCSFSLIVKRNADSSFTVGETGSSMCI